MSTEQRPNAEQTSRYRVDVQHAPKTNQRQQSPHDRLDMLKTCKASSNYSSSVIVSGAGCEMSPLRPRCKTRRPGEWRPRALRSSSLTVRFSFPHDVPRASCEETILALGSAS